MKLIKLNDDHFVIVDESEIKEGDYCLMFDDFGNIFLGNQPQKYLGEKAGHYLNKGLKKVTHSTEPLNDIEHKRVKTLSLSKIKELIGEVDINNKSKKYSESKPPMYEDAMRDGFIDGYKQSLEDNKDKVYTLQDMINAYREGTNAGALHERLCDYDNGNYQEADEYYNECEKKFIQSLQSESEWDVEFVDGKIKLI